MLLLEHYALFPLTLRSWGSRWIDLEGRKRHCCRTTIVDRQAKVRHWSSTGCGKTNVRKCPQSGPTSGTPLQLPGQLKRQASGPITLIMRSRRPSNCYEQSDDGPRARKTCRASVFHYLVYPKMGVLQNGSVRANPTADPDFYAWNPCSHDALGIKPSHYGEIWPAG